MEYIMDYLHNYFYLFKERGKFTINFNSVTIDGADLKGRYVEGQYVKIKGSANNDGIYKVIAVASDELPGITLEGCLSDEVFEGYICSLGIPKAFRKLADEIQAYNGTNPTTGIVSESFGGYSYTKATGTDGVPGWAVAFKIQLAPYRRMSDGFQFVKVVK